MPQMIFVNLPVSDLSRSIKFYEAIGFRNEPGFTNDKAAMMVLSESINVMLLTHPFFDGFTDRRRIDPRKEAQVLLAISRESREEVDAITQAAGKAGGTVDPCAVQDHGWMYGRSFADPDGTIWEPTWMTSEQPPAETEMEPADAR